MHAYKIIKNLVIISLIINLSIGEESKDCEKHVRQYKTGLATRELWALKMFDSGTKVPSGLFRGHLIHVGNFEECIDTNTTEFTGKYCRVWFSNASIGVGGNIDSVEEELYDILDITMLNQRDIPIPLPFQFAVCAPSTCVSEGIASIAEFNIQTITPLKVVAEVSPRSCYYNNDPSRDLDSADIAAISLVAVLLFVILITTIIVFIKEVFYQSNLKKSHGYKSALYQYISCFSLQRTWEQLTRIDNEQQHTIIKCIHAIRAISIFWVILAHTAYGFLLLINTLEFKKIILQSSFYMVVLNASVNADTFLFLSGLLFCYKVMYNKIKKGRKLTIPTTFILTVPLALVVFLAATVIGKISNGPMWGFYVEETITKPCKNNWWKTLLYINNYFDDNTCIVQSRFLSIDMQLTLLAPFLLFPMTRWPKYTIGVTIILILASFSATFAITYIYQLPWGFTIFYTNLETFNNFMDYIYLNTPIRASAYLCGILAGYVLAKGLHDEKFYFSRKPKVFYILGWVVSLGTFLTIVFSFYIYYKDGRKDYSNLKAAFYASLHRIGWCIAGFWIIYACVTNRAGSFGKWLSSKAWISFSRLSYGLFLIHLIVIYIEAGNRRTERFLSLYQLLSQFFVYVPFSLLGALLLYLIIQAPCELLLKGLFTNKKL